MNTKQIPRWIILLIVAIYYSLSGHTAYGVDYEPIKSLVNKYDQANDNNRKEIAINLSKTEPKSKEDMDNLRKVFSKKEWDENLYAAGIASLKKTKNASLNNTLIEILKDEKPLMEKLNQKDNAGKTESEVSHRTTNVMFIIMKLGEFKSQNAIPILKEYLAMKGCQYWASEALAKIGDKSASIEIRDRAYKGEDINYGGLGLDEAITIVQDLEDKAKKDKWRKITTQLVLIRDPKSKPYLKKLFNHEANYVRGQAAMAFSNMVTDDDVDTIIEMSKSKDWFVRSRGIDSMKRLRAISFSDSLIDLLMNDRDEVIRDHAAKALGYKKITAAIPFLEKALHDKALSVRQEAYIALYILTGKAYDYAGKTQAIEQKAEKERQSPSFW